MRREFSAMRQAAQINDAPHSRLASRQCEVLGGLVLPGFERSTVLHGVDQVVSCVHPGKYRHQRLWLVQVSLHQIYAGSYSSPQRLGVAAQDSDKHAFSLEASDQEY